MNTEEVLIELTECEQAAVIGGEATVSGAVQVAIAADTTATVGAVVSQWFSMSEAGFAMTWGEAGYVATGAATAPATLVAVGVAVDAYLINEAATEAASAYEAVGVLANQYQSMGESTVGSWFHAIFDGIFGGGE